MPGLRFIWPQSRVRDWAVAEAERLQRKKRRPGDAHWRTWESLLTKLDRGWEIAVLVDEPCRTEWIFAVLRHRLRHCWGWDGATRPLLDATEQNVAGHHARPVGGRIKRRAGTAGWYQSRKSDAPVNGGRGGGMTKPNTDWRSPPSGEVQCKSTPHRLSVAQLQRRGFYGQLGRVSVCSAAIRCRHVRFGVALVEEFRWTCRARPVLNGSATIGPSWLPVVGVGLHMSGVGSNPLFKTAVSTPVLRIKPDVLQAGVECEPAESSGVDPGGALVGLRGCRPTLPSVRRSRARTRLDPVGYRLWFRPVVPGHPVPNPTSRHCPPVSAPPVVYCPSS